MTVDEAIQRTMAWMGAMPAKDVDPPFAQCRLYPRRNCPGCERICARVGKPADQ